MRAMILAAGRGLRMGALTATTPKPLLRVGGRYLIEYSLQSLVKVGVHDIVINTSYLAHQIEAALGNGARYGVNLHYSYEPELLETGGGIFQALPILGNKPFIVLSSDIISDYDLQQLPVAPSGLAHIVLVDNPSFHPAGDFCLSGQKIYFGKEKTLTFGNIGIYRPELFADCVPGKFRLGDVLKKAILNQQISGEHYTGIWDNIGTPEQLQTPLRLIST